MAAAVLVAVGAGLYAARSSIGRIVARHHFARAESALATLDDSAARAELQAALLADPLHREARERLARLELRGGRLEHAFLQALTLTEAYADDVDGWRTLAEVRIRAAQPAEAEDAISHAVEAAPDRAELRRMRAELRFRIGRIYGALLDARAVLDRDRTDEVAASILSRATARLEASGPAADAPAPDGAPLGLADRWPGTLGTLMHDLVARMRARDWTGAGMLASSARADYEGTMLGPWLAGTVELSQGDLDSAEKHFRSALEIAPRSHRVITSLIAVWSRLKGPSWSAEQLLRLSDRDPQFTYLLNIAALAFVEADQPSRAESVLQRAFVALPSSPVPYRDLAEYHLRLDRPSDALAVCADGLARFPDDAGLRLLSARGSSDLGDREAAIRSYESVLAARPDDRTAAAQLARMLVLARKDDASRARALQLVRHLALDAPSDASVLGAMAYVALKAGGDARRAASWLEPAVRMASDEPSLHFQLASAYAQLGEKDSARRELTASLQTGRAFEEEAEARRLLARLGGTPADSTARANAQ